MEVWQQLRLVGEVVLAMLLGGVVGLERELAHKPAGLRTHALVAGASALIVGLSETLVWRLAGTDPAGTLRGDPVRVLQAVVTGVSFLGAGAIIHSRRDRGVEGLTTAASLLMVATIGVTAAVHLWVLAAGVALLVLVVLHLGKRVEQHLRPPAAPPPPSSEAPSGDE